MSVLLIYGDVSRFSFLGGGVTAPSDFSILVPRFSFLGGGVTGPLALALVRLILTLGLFCLGSALAWLSLSLRVSLGPVYG